MRKLIQHPENLINEIIEKGIYCYFISPHLDDAMLSAGGLISYLSDKTGITVINVFTGCGDGKSTFSAKAFLKQCHSNNPEKLFDIRVKEDKRVFDKLKLFVINLGFTDALWRKTKNSGVIRSSLGQFLPEFTSLYPTYKFHVVSGKRNREDNKLEAQIKTKLRATTKAKEGRFIVFCPFGFGNHIDHLIVRDACNNYFKTDVIYWSDFPYYLEAEDTNKLFDLRKSSDIKTGALTKFVYSDRIVGGSIYKNTMDLKKQLCELYSSQINQVVKDKTTLYKQETFYIRDKRVDNFQIEISEFLDHRLMKEWQELWERSRVKHYFNSPVWFISCQRAFNYSKTLFIRCYKNFSLVGILPLVLTKKYGIPTYSFPGEQYLDKSSLLLEDYDTQILDALLVKSLDIGNVYLSEIETGLLDHYKLTENKIGFFKSSSCPFLPLLPNPYQYLDSYNKNKVARKIKDEGKNLRYKVFIGNIEQHLATLRSIETQSTKAKDLKETFTDTKAKELYLQLGKLNNNSLYTYLLYYNNEPICYRLGFVYGDTYQGSNTAYKSSFSFLMPGKILAFLMLPELIKKGIKTLDFSRGENPLKRDFTPYSYDQFSIYYSEDPFVMLWWKTLNNLRTYIEKYPRLYEMVRKTKKKIKLNSLALMHFKEKVQNITKRRSVSRV